MKKNTIKGVKRYGVYFLHSLGWTFIQAEGSKRDAIIEMNRSKKSCPNFEYKVIPVLITPITKTGCAKCGYYIQDCDCKSKVARIKVGK